MDEARRVILVGAAGGQGRDILDALVAAGRHVAGVLDDTPGLTTVSGMPVLGPIAAWSGLNFDGGFAFALGIGSPPARRAVGTAILAAGGELASAIHPRAVISPRATVGRGVAILAGCVIAPDATIGDFVILNANCSVDHDCLLGAAVQFGPGVSLAGGVEIGEEAFVGVGASLLPGVTVGRAAVVGGGAVVVKPVADATTVAGSPARPLERR